MHRHPRPRRQFRRPWLTLSRGRGRSPCRCCRTPSCRPGSCVGRRSAAREPPHPPAPAPRRPMQLFAARPSLRWLPLPLLALSALLWLRMPGRAAAGGSTLEELCDCGTVEPYGYRCACGDPSGQDSKGCWWVAAPTGVLRAGGNRVGAASAPLSFAAAAPAAAVFVYCCGRCTVAGC